MTFLTSFLLAVAPLASAHFKCTPIDDCWPYVSTWNALNTTIHGKLIQNQPIARPCYHGRNYDPEQCQDVSSHWLSNSWLAERPTGYSYPTIETCPAINATLGSQHYPQCDLGNYPVYSVNATETSDVAAGIAFAKKHNIRLTIKNTGHDIIQRSQGYASLSIWTKYIRRGLEFQKRYTPALPHCASNYTGRAIKIGGSYVWDDVYQYAHQHDSIVVGGDDRTVGTIGGYLQGGGHGPASHEFGLGADQVLEYQVVLATGQVVTASQCQHSDLFTALRGGGGGTFGIVTSATVKAYPDRPALGHELTIIAAANASTELVNVTADIMAAYPALVDEGFAGTAILTHADADGSMVYMHPLVKLLGSNSSAEINRAKDVMNSEIVNKWLPLNGTSLLIKSEFILFDSFLAWYNSHGHTTNGGNRPIMASWFFDKDSLASRQSNKHILNTFLFGQGTRTTTGSATLFNLVAGGKVLEPQPFTAVNPAWRRTYALIQQIDFWPDDAGYQEIAQVKKELTDKKLQVMKDAAPGMGTYGNEADPHDPDWRESWWGKENYEWLASAKKRYDPDDVFWCWRCVGNDAWAEVTGGTSYGPLQHVGTG